ncbi:MAG: putative lipoprotein [Clostridiales bacterium]|jgi:major membrane immunogen (membrane-anchored lipoprotein)|nr:putative lipoprotein [Clostridiales bacterium]
MLRIKLGVTILALTMPLGILAGCGSKPAASKPAESKPATSQAQPAATQAQPAATQQASSSGKLVDGVYKVEFDNFDSHDYKGQLELTVSGGKISEVKFDEVKKDGSLKSKDEQYKKQMEAVSKTYPEKAYTALKKNLIDKQSAAVDTVAGATASTKTFKDLAKYAVDEMAKKGVTAPAKIPAPKN